MYREIFKFQYQLDLSLVLKNNLVSWLMKVLVLPQGESSGLYQIIKLPLAKNIGETKSYLLQNNEIFELKEINGNNPHNIQANRPQLKNGDGVKSWIFEGNPGYVVQSGNLIVASKFNLIFLLISILFNNGDKFSQRFISFEDLLDQLASLYGEWINNIPQDIFIDKLPQVCEIVNQDSENYYKFSITKANEFIKLKIDQFLHYITSTPNSITNLIKMKLQDPSLNSIPSDIILSAQLNHAVEFVTNSYCLPSFKQQFLSSNSYDFTKLFEYQTKLKDQQKARDIVDQTVNNIAISNSNVPKKKPAPKKQTKKQPTKVAVGKGALDGFFSRK